MAKGKKTGGRVKGTPNKATSEIKDLARRLLEDPVYLQNLRMRLRDGTAGSVEPLLYHYAYGKPKEERELSGTLTVRWADETP